VKCIDVAQNCPAGSFALVVLNLYQKLGMCGEITVFLQQTKKTFLPYGRSISLSYIFRQ
jgi:hypothetical protein